MRISQEYGLKYSLLHATRGEKIADLLTETGSIKPGKDADIVVYDGHPFHYLTKATAVFINGQNAFCGAQRQLVRWPTAAERR